MFGSFKICTVMGIPIRLHFTLILLLPFFATRMAANIGISVLWGWLAAVALFASVALHELGHAWVSIQRGYGVRDIILSPIGGVALLTSSPRKSSDEFWIAVAGPIVSLVLALLFCFLGFFALPTLFGGITQSIAVMQLIGLINLSLFLFNLLPCFPMDGGRVYRSIIMKKRGRLEATRQAVKIGRYFAIFMGIVGLMYNWLLMIIAIFIYMAAKAELRGVEFEEMRRRGAGPAFGFGGFGFPPPGAPPFQSPPRVENEHVLDDHEVKVSPPPYKQ